MKIEFTPPATTRLTLEFQKGEVAALVEALQARKKTRPQRALIADFVLALTRITTEYHA